MVGVVAVAENFLQGGHSAIDTLTRVGIARGHHLVIVSEVHLIDMLGSIGGELRFIFCSEHLSPELVGSVAL